MKSPDWIYWLVGLIGTIVWFTGVWGRPNGGNEEAQTPLGKKLTRQGRGSGIVLGMVITLLLENWWRGSR